MAETRVQRRLAAILAADVAGYSRLMGADEEGTLARLKAHRAELIDPCLGAHGGRLVKLTGDGALVEFASVIDAVRCAVEVQKGMVERNAVEPEERRIQFRIGVNLGDIIIDGDDIYGDGVNVAARLEALAEPGGIVISAKVHDEVAGRLDAAFDDLGTQEMKNIAQPVRCYRVRLVASPATAPAATFQAAGESIHGPAVAVLPFQNLSADPDQDYFADGLAEDLITGLSLWRSFPVIARNSTFAFKGTSPDVREVGKRLGARYVLEGSVRKAGVRVRVTVQLIDAQTAHHLWAERYDRKIEDIFELQDEIALKICATVMPHLERAEQRRWYSDKSQNLDAWDLCHRGMAHIHKLTGADNAAARSLFERAIALDPEYARAYIGLAYSHHRDIYLDAVKDRESSLRLMYENLRRAISLDDSISDAHVLMAIAHTWSQRTDDAVAEAERALELNPSNAMALFSIANCLTSAGRHREALAVFERAFSLNPQDPLCHIYYSFSASAYLHLEDFSAAVATAQKALQREPGHRDAQLLLLSALGHLGRQEEAAEVLRRLGAARLGDLQSRALFQSLHRQEDKDRYIEGLRKAGVPE